MTGLSSVARAFFARYEDVEAPDWDTPADLSRMGVESMAREDTRRFFESCLDTRHDTTYGSLMTQTSTPAARYTLTVTARGFDSDIVREFVKLSQAVDFAKAAATHPSCIQAEVVSIWRPAICFVARYEG